MHIIHSQINAADVGKRFAELEWGFLHVIEGQPCKLVWGKEVRPLYLDGFFDEGWFEWKHAAPHTKLHLKQAGLLDNFPVNIFISFQRVNTHHNPRYSERIYMSRSAIQSKGNTPYCPFQAYIKEKFKRAGIKKTEATTYMHSSSIS